jgi:hypothetical protein
VLWRAASGFQARPELEPWEVNTERSYYEEQVLTPDSKHEGADFLIASKAPPNEVV